MREILFKGKRLDNGEWVEGIPIQTHIGLFICFEENPHYCHQYSYMEIDGIIKVDENTICQYTGLTDKNGKKIWENDIICNHYDSLYPEEETMVLIVWDNFGWKIKESSSAEEINTAIDIENCEVVGNIFDNPELLGGLTDGN